MLVAVNSAVLTGSCLHTATQSSDAVTAWVASTGTKPTSPENICLSMANAAIPPIQLAGLIYIQTCLLYCIQ